MTLSLGRSVRPAIAVGLLLIGSAVYLLASSGQARSQGSAPSQVLLQHFGALSSPSNASDSAASEGVNAFAHQLTTNDASLQQWIAGRGDSLCVMESDKAVEPDAVSPAFACDPIPADKIESDLLVLGAGGHRGSGGSALLVGLAPDGVSAISITYSDETTETAPVVDNGFHAASAGRQPVSYRWTSADGKTHVKQMGGA